MSVARLKKRFSSDKALSQNGVWLTIDLEDGGQPLEFLLASLGRANRKWASEASRVYRHHKRKIEAGLMSDEESIERSLRVFCNTVLLDWRGVTDEDDQPIPYSSEEGYKLLSECDRLYDYLLEESQEISNFQDSETAKTVGKSKPTLVGR